MNFSSIPAYLDPANWQQQPNHRNGSSSSSSTGPAGNISQLTSAPPLPTPPLPPPLPPLQPHGSTITGSIRPGSMADRARMANIPMPEAALQCPRCESTNTKFCYYNNYNLSQPRHFCKACRRYWTRGGALRSVPVGGGCRRNKRSKSTSKSPAGSDNRSQASTSTGPGSSNIGINSNSTTGNILSTHDHVIGVSHQVPSLRFMTPNLHQLTDHFGCGDSHISLNYGLNYGGTVISAPMGGSHGDLNFHLGSVSLGDGNEGSSTINTIGGPGGGLGGSFLGLDQWRPPQFSFMGSGLDTSMGLFESGRGSGGSSYGGGDQVGELKVSNRSTKESSDDQIAGSMKMEEAQGLNLGRQYFGSQGNDHGQHYNWGGLNSSFTSSSNPRN